MATGRGIRAGRAYVELGANDAELLRVLNRGRKRLIDFGRDTARIGVGITGAAAGGAAALGKSLFAYTAFDDKIRSVGAVTRSTKAELGFLERAALLLGRTTSYTAVQVANLQGTLGRAGFKTKEIDDATAAVLNLARATEVEPDVAAGATASTLRQFGLEANQATRVADAFTATANGSFNTLENLIEAMKFAGPAAADAGLEIEEALSLLGALGNVGLQGSEGGTSIRRLLTILAAEPDKFSKAFGVATADSKGNLRSLVDVLAEVDAATADLGTAERGKVFAEAFGLLGITSASVLGKSSLGIRKLEADLARAAGTAARTAEAIDAGAGGETRRLGSAFEGTQIAAGKAIADGYQAAAAAAGRFLNVATDYIGENPKLVRGLAKLVVGALGVGAALTVAGGAAVVFGTTLGLTALAGLAAFAGVPALLVGVVAAFNGGEVAGINFGNVVIGLADDLGILSRVAPKLAATRALEEAARAAQKLGGEVEAARRRVEQAPDLAERIRAQQELVGLLKAQAEAQVALQLKEQAADAKQARQRRGRGRRGPQVDTPARIAARTARQAAVEDISRQVSAAEQQLAGLEATLDNTLDQSFTPKVAAELKVELKNLTAPREELENAVGPDLPLAVRVGIADALAETRELLAGVRTLAEGEDAGVDVALRVQARTAELEDLARRLEGLRESADLPPEVALAVRVEAESVRRVVEATRQAVEEQAGVDLQAEVDVAPVRLRGVAQAVADLTQLSNTLAPELPTEVRADFGTATFEARKLAAEFAALGEQGTVSVGAVLRVRGELDRLAELAGGLQRVALAPDVDRTVGLRVQLAADALSAAVADSRRQLQDRIGVKLDADVDLSGVVAALADVRAAGDALTGTLPVRVQPDTAEALRRLDAVSDRLTVLSDAERLPVDVAVRTRADLRELAEVAEALRTLADEPDVEAEARVALLLQADAALATAEGVRERVEKELGVTLEGTINLAAVKVAGAEAAGVKLREALEATPADVAVTARADIRRAEAELDPLQARLATLRDAGVLEATVDVDVIADRDALTAAAEQLQTIADRAGVPAELRVAVESRVGALLEQVGQLDAALTRRRVLEVEPQLVEKAGFLDTLNALVASGKEAAAKGVRNALDFNASLASFGGSQSEAAVARIRVEARNLKDQAKEFGFLTDELAADIDRRTQIEIKAAVEANVTQAATFDGSFRAADLAAIGGATSTDERIARAAEETARHTKATTEAVGRIKLKGGGTYR